MKTDLHLYIGSQEVELTDAPAILYTYTVDDLTNPTAVKNSFSKTITLQGTPQNNKIFGHYWNVERAVGQGSGNAGVDYNASKKAPFQIIVNGEIYESGYVKLEKVNRVGNGITYDIGLFGGLGDYFYSLSFNPNTGGKLKLSDLDYYTGGEDEFDFVASATTVMNAWEDLELNHASKWQHINFAPAYNGLPDDFDASKVLINLSGTSLPQTVVKDGKVYSSRSGYVIADLPQDMTEWEIRDLRSYLQRPVIRMKSIVNACCNPQQNGGYDVVLDPDFFNSDNPYWEKTWLTLPLVKNLEFSNEEQVMEGSTLVPMTTTGNANKDSYQSLVFDLGEFGSSIPSSITVKATIDNYAAYSNTSYAWFWNWNGDSYHTGWWCLGSLYVQLLAFNGDTVVGASDAYNLTTPIRHNGKLYFGCNKYYGGGQEFKPYMDKNVYDILGSFGSGGFRREGESAPVVLPFTIRNLNSPISGLKFYYFWGATPDKLAKRQGSAVFQNTYSDGWVTMSCSSTHNVNAEDVKATVKSSTLKAVLGASLGRTGTNVTKALLLNTEDSPCDYLLSYCKMFGLYFRKEPEENKIYIETRKTFYKRNEVVNLENYIDRSKDIKIDPLVFTTKWYQMIQPSDETEWYKKYLATRGIQYGCKMLNTGYEFSVEKKDLYENSTIRSGIEGLEKSKYFTAFNNDKVQRNWMYMGLKYDLFNGDDTAEASIPVRNNGDLRGINENEGMKYYDVLPKLQFHDDDNKPTDGNNCLVFLSGFKALSTNRTNPIYYWMTDDNPQQTFLNEGTPCWLFTSSATSFAHRIDGIPVFERYLTAENSGKIEKSLDFGTSQELFAPDYNITESVNIYSNYWRAYIEDLFNPDTKVLTCYVAVNGKIGSEWMRRFYWFDNAVWRLNRVSDWNVCDYGTTQMEFVKVQDISDYTSVTQASVTRITLTPSAYNIDANGGSITLSVSITNGGAWTLSYSNRDVYVSRTSGVGDGTVTVVFPSNNDDDLKYYYFTASSEDNAQGRCTIVQSYAGETDFIPIPEDIIIPASGGSVFIDFIWKNQGDDYVALVDFNEGEDYLQFTADTRTYRDQNKALLTFSANTGTTTLHNYCQFQNYEGTLNRSIGIDQLPAEYTFDASGGTQVVTLAYSPNSVFNNVPDWVTITEGDDGYEIVAKENVYASDNEATITVTNTSQSTAQFRVVQATNGGSGGGGQGGNEVNPLNLYYNATDNSVKYLTINLPDGWWVNTSASDFWHISQDRGDAGVNVIGVTVDNNTGNTRTGTIVVNTVNSSYTVTVSQLGEGAVETIAVTPTAATVNSAATAISITVVYENRNGYVVFPVTSSSAVTCSPIVWTGETGTTTASIAKNEDASARTHTITFNGRNGISATTTINQSAAPEQAIPDDGGQNIPQEGGDNGNGITSNTSWTATTSDAWISVSPTSGTSGYTQIDIIAQPNTSTSNRIGYVYIRSIADNTLLSTIIVTQGAFSEYLTVSPSTLNFDSTGGVLSFTINSNTNWTIE